MYAEQCVFVTIWDIAMCGGISFHRHILYIVAWTYNYIGIKAKCRHLKRFTGKGKGTLRQVFCDKIRWLDIKGSVSYTDR